MSRFLVDLFGGPTKFAFKLTFGGSIACLNYLTTENEPRNSARNQIMKNEPVVFYSHLFVKSLFFGAFPQVTLGVAMVNPNYIYTMWHSPVNYPYVQTRLESADKVYIISDEPDKDYRHPFIWSISRMLF